MADTDAPETIYDMYGFPEALYKIVYDAPGAPSVAHKAKELIRREVTVDNTWGLDHGTWSVLHRVYPKKDIPVFQLSVDALATPEQHYQMGRELRELRDQGVLIFGSGNVVHNLARIDWNNTGGFAWAQQFDAYIKDSIIARDHDNVIHYERAGEAAALSFRSIDHYAPLLYVLGASGERDDVTVFNDACVLGSLSMTSYLLGDA